MKKALFVLAVGIVIFSGAATSCRGQDYTAEQFQQDAAKSGPFWEGAFIRGTVPNPSLKSSSPWSWVRIAGTNYKNNWFRHVAGGNTYIAEWSVEREGMTSHHARGYDKATDTWSDIVDMGADSTEDQWTFWGPYYYWMGTKWAVSIWKESGFDSSGQKTGKHLYHTRMLNGSEWSEIVTVNWDDELGQEREPLGPARLLYEQHEWHNKSSGSAQRHLVGGHCGEYSSSREAAV